MRAHARKVRGILTLQQQLHCIEEWKLADLQRQLDQLEKSQHDLIRALNQDDTLQGLFIDALARRVRSLADEISRICSEKDAQSARLLEHVARKICAERLAEVVDRRVMRANDKKQLVDAIDCFVSLAAQASGKIAER